ncbi:WbqC family protein [Kitasatospora purpeofusca]|uniref:WbqC family protein n=1 Tax=Kitasatospora purpeofusca TaxID=67352 RepID=UPI0036CF48EE
MPIGGSSTLGSPAASSDRPTATDTGPVCAIHQPNLLPRLSVLAKILAADVWVVLDDVQHARRDHQHRARLGALTGDATRWLSLPTSLPNGRVTLIRDARLTDPARSRRHVEGVLRERLGDGALGHPAAAPFDRIIATVSTSAMPTPWPDRPAAAAARHRLPNHRLRTRHGQLGLGRRPTRRLHAAARQHGRRPPHRPPHRRRPHDL